jgi:hypothetical protein
MSERLRFRLLQRILMNDRHGLISGEQSTANVTTSIVQNIYVYSSGRLWLAYGVAILLTAVTCIPALLAMYSAGASYTTNFSTILRATLSGKLDVDTNEINSRHSDLLPDELADAHLLETIDMDQPDIPEEVEIEAKAQTIAHETNSTGDGSAFFTGHGTHKEDITVVNARANTDDAVNTLKHSEVSMSIQCSFAES